MSNYKDEFKDVKKGLPAENAKQKASINFVLLFTIVGVAFGLAILLFQNNIISVGIVISQSGNNVPAQVIVNGILAFLVGSVQAWIFKARIKSRTHIFIAFAIVGGIIAGLVGGLLMNAGLLAPLAIGMIDGALAGGISSSGQNRVMRNKKYGSKWLLYSILSWAAIYSISWVIGWEPEGGTQMALAVVFLMIASGISLAIFLNSTPEIEFL